MLPSEVHFLKEDTLEIEAEMRDQIERRFRHLDPAQLPRLQVAQKDGLWFALNNTMLSVFQSLEQQQRCQKVPVEVVALSKVPRYLQQEMLCDRGRCTPGRLQEGCVRHHSTTACFLKPQPTRRTRRTRTRTPSWPTPSDAPSRSALAARPA